MNDEIVLCGASSYNQKYYFNPEFGLLPSRVQEELRVLCVLFTEEVGGILTLVFDEEGHLCLRTEAAENDPAFDEIGSALRVKQLRVEKKELFESLELFYQAFAGEEY